MLAEPGALFVSHLAQLPIENPSRPTSGSSCCDTGNYNKFLTKGSLSLVSMMLGFIGVKYVSKGVDAGYESHIRAFTYLGFAVVFIWGLSLFPFSR
jgi:hypothetical protein